MINIHNPEMELWGVHLNFGKNKSGKFKFPIVFNDFKNAELIYPELNKLIGKPLDEVKNLSEPIYEKFKQYHYTFARPQ